MYFSFELYQIEALKAIGVSEVVLAINYQPEVKRLRLFLQCTFSRAVHKSLMWIVIVECIMN